MEILFGLLCGLCKGEILELKFSDIDYIHRILKVSRQLGKKANTNVIHLKTGEYTKQDIKVKSFSSNRILDIPDIVFEAVSNLMGNLNEIITMDVFVDNEEIISDCLEELEPFIERVRSKKIIGADLSNNEIINVIIETCSRNLCCLI